MKNILSFVIAFIALLSIAWADTLPVKYEPGESVRAAMRNLSAETSLVYSASTLKPIGILVVQTEPPAPRWSGSFYYDFQTSETSAVVLTRLTTFRDMFGRKGLDLDLDLFAGVTLSEADPLGGVALGKRWSLDRESRLWLYLGAGVRAREGTPISGGILAGVSVAF